MDDLDLTVKAIDGPVVLVGHSAGGMVVQKALQRYARLGQRPVGSALIASIPPSGLGPLNARLSLTDPFFFSRVGMVLAGGGDASEAYAVVRDMLFTKDAPDELVARAFSRWLPESPRLLTDLTAAPRTIWARRDVGELMVMGFGQDQLIDRTAVMETAYFYSAPSLTLTKAAHAAIMEDTADLIAEALTDWVDRLITGDDRPLSAANL